MPKPRWPGSGKYPKKRNYGRKTRKDLKQDKEIKKLKQQVKQINKGIKTKVCIKKFDTIGINKYNCYTTPSRLYEFPKFTVTEGGQNVAAVEMIDEREEDKILLLRTKVHLKLTQLIPGTQYRVMMINLIDTGTLDIISSTAAKVNLGQWLRHANWDMHNGQYFSIDHPELILRSPLNYQDKHKFKVVYDKLYTVPNNPIHYDPDGQTVLNTKYHMININHKKGKKTGLDVEFQDGLNVSDKNRLFVFVYTNSESIVNVKGFSMQYFKDVE